MLRAVQIPLSDAAHEEAARFDPGDPANPAERRFPIQVRRVWLQRVEEETAQHREAVADRHAHSAEVALEPQIETMKVRKPRIRAKRKELHACRCDRDAEGFELGIEVGLPVHAGDGCGAVVFPAPPDNLLWGRELVHVAEDWRRMSYALLDCSQYDWCKCETILIGPDDGPEWCHGCNGPTHPNPLNPDDQAAIEQHFAIAMRLYPELANAVTDWAEAFLERRRHLQDVAGRSNPEVDQQLEAITGARPRTKYESPWPRGAALPGAIKHPRGSVTGYDWHKAREKGQRERFDRVAACGAEEMKQICSACDAPGKPIPLTCDNYRLCLHCRGRRVQKFRSRFRTAQAATMQGLWRHRLTTTRKGRDGRLMDGGKWSEKFLTLTLPHSGNAAADVGELQRAWRKFWRKLRTHFELDILQGEDKIRRRELMKLIRYTRVLEITEGSKGEGHAHLHVWWVGPFVHHEMIRQLWGGAQGGEYQQRLIKAECVAGLEEVIGRMGDNRRIFAEQLRGYLRTMRGKNGRPLAVVWQPVIDIRAPTDMAAELCKYLIKDCLKEDGGKLTLLDPAIFARLYEALEGHRAIATSRGLFEPQESECYCHECGGLFRRFIEAVDFGHDPRGPPPVVQLEMF